MEVLLLSIYKSSFDLLDKILSGSPAAGRSAGKMIFFSIIVVKCPDLDPDLDSDGD